MAKQANVEKNTEGSKSSARNFRSSSDIENFYRFIHDNGLRREALMMVDAVYKHLNAEKKKAERKKKAKSKRAAKKALLQ